MSTNGPNSLDEREEQHTEDDFSSQVPEEGASDSEPTFHSEDIKEQKDHGDLFVNVEGAERRKRAAEAAALKYAVTKKEASDRFSRDLKRTTEERERAEAKKKADLEAEAARQAIAQKKAQEQLDRENDRKTKEAIRQAELDNQKRAAEAKHQEKQEQKLERSRKMNALFWHGGRKFVTIAVLLIIIIAPILTFNVIIPAIERNALQQEFNARAESNEKAAEVDGKSEYNMYSNDGTQDALDESEREFEEEIAKLSGRDKLYMILRYARFVFNHTTDSKRAAAIAERAKDLPSNDDERIDYYVCIRDIYDLGGYPEEAEEYTKIIIELMPEVAPGNMDDYGNIQY